MGVWDAEYQVKGKRVKAANGSRITTTNTFRATTAGHVTSHGFPICVAEDSVHSNVSTLTVASIIQTFSADAVLTAHFAMHTLATKLAFCVLYIRKQWLCGFTTTFTCVL